jgi:hypothetical protein
MWNAFILRLAGESKVFLFRHGAPTPPASSRRFQTRGFPHWSPIINARPNSRVRRANHERISVMKLKTVLGLAVACFAYVSNLSAISFATAVTSYDPGEGYATDFETGLGYTLTEAALGQPNRDTAFGPVQPFNPPFARSELLSLGVGGHVVFEFGAPIANDPQNPFGLDFIVYGSAGFIDVSFPDGHTDESASTFGQNPGQTLVSVSLDNKTFYTLDPARAPVVDSLYPTDGAGEFGLPVDPSLTQLDFADKSLEAIRSLYGGSAGGTGYDLGWALDGNGESIFLGGAQYVRIDVVAGRAEIDGLAVVPEPSTRALLGMGFGLLALVMARRHSTVGRNR